jgi:predicted nucleic acid-binding protein
MTVAELDRWALARRWGTARKHDLQYHLQQRYVIQPFSRELCLSWAEATHSASQHGFAISCADAWVAAVALLNHIPLITNNAEDFRGVTNLTVITEHARFS